MYSRCTSVEWTVDLDCVIFKAIMIRAKGDFLHLGCRPMTLSGPLKSANEYT